MEQLDDIKSMIRAQIASIQSLEERAAFRELMEQVFVALWETNENMYQDLRDRVTSELDCDLERYRVRVGLAERDSFDRAHQLMAPAWEGDLEKPVYRAGEMREQLEKTGQIRLATVLVRGTPGEMKSFLVYGENCRGRLKTEKGKEYEVPVFLEPARRYVSQLEHLYHLFMKNGIPWQTVNAPYFFKMADVCVRRIPDGISSQEEVTDFGADFGAFNSKVRFGLMPVWNIRRLELESMGFPVPCKDHESYEHTIFIGRYGVQNAYLVEEKAGIENVCQRGDYLYITGKAANEKRWDVYTIRTGKEGSMSWHGYPVFENMRKNTFGEVYSRKKGQPVRTKGELERFVRGFGLEEYIRYQDCALTGEWEETQETYPVNAFLKDEIRGTGGRKKLTLYFKPAGKERWLLPDLASFITSEVQELYPEYQCGGRLI